jgi:V/A-type H+-transporting ATPase subunit K
MVDLTVAQGASIFAAAIPIGLVGIFSGIAQGKAAAAGIMLVGKNPSELSKGMLFAAMVETYAVLALLISFLMLNSIQL